MSTFEALCGFDFNFVSSTSGMLRMFALATSGGVFGIISSNKARYSGNSSAYAESAVTELMLWVSVTTWVFTLISFLVQCYGKQFLNKTAEIVMHSTFALAYLTSTILWAVYLTWGSSAYGSPTSYYPSFQVGRVFQNGDHAFIVVLAAASTSTYVTQAIMSMIAKCHV
uniref:Uncharacterized LOC100180325 n=1 Tax=Ciona intestinalis TaxID=7719 RepID=A0A1W2WPE0_CIOIN|nr:uncharacterized protein LOC100180325 [Ciona intestinalis]|eukprot:XP_009861151.1 uncharacterized protein LOC100180325 [Ciona intestinalis]